MQYIKAFIDDPDGAVTVDWVVLTAAVSGLGIAVLTLIWGESGGAAEKVSDFLSTTSVTTSF